MIFLMIYWILFVSILLRISVSGSLYHFMRISVSFQKLIWIFLFHEFLFGFGIGVILVARKAFGNTASLSVSLKSLRNIGVTTFLKFLRIQWWIYWVLGLFSWYIFYYVFNLITCKWISQDSYIFLDQFW